MDTKRDGRPCPALEEFIRLPGLFRRWEFEQVLDGSDEFHVQTAGATEDGTTLFIVYCRESSVGGDVLR